MSRTNFKEFTEFGCSSGLQTNSKKRWRDVRHCAVTIRTASSNSSTQRSLRKGTHYSIPFRCTSTNASWNPKRYCSKRYRISQHRQRKRLSLSNLAFTRSCMDASLTMGSNLQERFCNCLKKPVSLDLCTMVSPVWTSEDESRRNSITSLLRKSGGWYSIWGRRSRSSRRATLHHL